ncbi:MAG: hypothetical protein M3283_10840 [Actinomycetota bacterium]|nr:hypothetical protein [Actinomycetota bacterium]
MLPIAGFEGLIREISKPARALTLPTSPEEPPDEAEMEQIFGMRERLDKLERKLG